MWSKEADNPVISLNLTEERKSPKYGGKGKKNEDEQVA